MKNTADVTGGKPIAVLLQSISGVSAINPLVAFYDIHGGKREVLFFYFAQTISHSAIWSQTNGPDNGDILFFVNTYYTSKHLNPIQTDMHTNVCTVRRSNLKPLESQAVFSHSL
jgi:hypothetical protein